MKTNKSVINTQMQKLVSTINTMERALMTNLDQLRHCSSALRRVLFSQYAERPGHGLRVTIPNRSRSPEGSRIKRKHSRNPKRSERSRSHSRSRSISRSRSRSRSRRRSDRSIDPNKRRCKKDPEKEKSRHRSKKCSKPNSEILCPKLQIDSPSSSSDESDLLAIEEDYPKLE